MVSISSELTVDRSIGEKIIEPIDPISIKPIPIDPPIIIYPPILPYYRVSSLKDVPGKEYSNNVDKKTTGQADPGQTLNWFGNGNTTDGFDYTIRGQVDAMANSGDALYSDVVRNKAALVFSTSFDDRIFYETSIGFSRGIWATPEKIDKPGPGMDLGVTDVDGLELWGPTDANRFSVYGDPEFAVYDYNGIKKVGLYTQKEIAKAIGVGQKFAHLVNLDAMMTSGKNQIMFSIDPIEELGFDGGEIWVLNRSVSPVASFLNHGGHVWNTKFEVKKTFGTASENINALEAIEEYSIYLPPWLDSIPVKTRPIPSNTPVVDILSPDIKITALPELKSVNTSAPEVGVLDLSSSDTKITTLPPVELMPDKILPGHGKVFDPDSSESLKSLDLVTEERTFYDGEKYYTLDIKDEVLSLDYFFVAPGFNNVPSPKRVYGKEYSNSVDKKTTGQADPGQTLEWNGSGGTNDGFDYTIRGQVDAMANSGDGFFSAVIRNKATLVFSTSFDDRIFYETPTGGHNIWATPDKIDQPGPGMDLGVTDVDGLELWGPTDANRFSVYGDPEFAVYDYNGIDNVGLYTQDEIAGAIGVGRKFAHLVNVDAMMTSGDDLIMFSIDPIEELGLDGGEIWVWDRDPGVPAGFLIHGGHIWNTDFEVKKTFGTASENVNALEAIGRYTIFDGGYDLVAVDPLKIPTGDGVVPLSN